MNSSDFAGLPADVRNELLASIERLRTRQASVARASAQASASDAYFSAQSGDEDEEEEEAEASAVACRLAVEASQSQQGFSQAQLGRVLDKARTRSSAAPHVVAAAASSSAACRLASSPELISNVRMSSTNSTLDVHIGFVIKFKYLITLYFELIANLHCELVSVCTVVIVCNGISTTDIRICSL